MFCGYCGIENEKGASFCKNCGQALGKPSGSEADNNVKSTPDKEKTTSIVNKLSGDVENKQVKLLIKAFIGLGVAFAVLIVIIVIVANTKATINMDDYITFQANGFDGYGTATYDIDWKAINEKYGDKLKFSSKAREEQGELINLFTPIDAVMEGVSIELNPNSELSNGDEVQYTWDIDDDLSEYVNCKVKYSDGSYIISGLKEVGSFDAFADLNVVFSGISPNGHADIEYIGSDLSYYDFSYDKTSGLKNGDIVKVTLVNDNPDKYVEALGKIPESFEKEYEVSGLDEYVSSFTNLDDSFVETLKKETEDSIYSYAASSYSKDVSLKDLTYAGFILNSQKEHDGWGNYNNLYIIYSGDVSSTEGNFSTSKVYYPVNFSNILSNADGFSYDSNDGIQGNSYIDGRVNTRGYSNPLECYIEIVEKNRDSYDSECGDGFEVYAEYDQIEKLSDISDQFRTELQADAKNKVESYVADYNYGTKASELTFNGEYLLTAKNQGSDFSKNNYYVIVYSAYVTNEDDRFDPVTVYYPVEYDGIVKLPGGEYMVTKKDDIYGNSKFPGSYYTTKGFVDGEEMYSKIVTANRDNYSYVVSDGLKEFGE